MAWQRIAPCGGGPSRARERARENFSRFNGNVSAYLGKVALTRCLNHKHARRIAPGQECALIVDAYSPCDMAQPAEAAACSRVRSHARRSCRD
jgi:hypothetical protein